MNGADHALWDQLKLSCAKGSISYRDYIDLVLYADQCGYYTRDHERVGRHFERDFYTAESLGRVFAELVTCAAHDLLGAATAAQSTFVEIAAEPGTDLLSHLHGHPFADSHVIRRGDPIIASGPVVIFANEWLDALPFHRLVFCDGQWHERGVGLSQAGALQELRLDTLSPAVADICQRLPVQAPTGYQLDLPLQAESALAELLAQDWTGLLLLFDYGKTWQVLTSDCPAGTARTYRQHSQANDLLDQPGTKDITCDICWDPLVDLCRQEHLKSVTLETQESFFVQRAQGMAESIISGTAASFSPDRQTLMELIHPAHMGRRFQVLWGVRTS